MTSIRMLVRGGGLAAAFLWLAGGPVLSHHGWSWTEEGFFQIEGTITEIYIGNPHATLDVEVEGETWRVELAPPSRTIAAGSTEDAAAEGDTVIAIGYRSLDANEKRMKAVRLVIGEKTFDVYSDMLPPA